MRAMLNICCLLFLFQSAYTQDPKEILRQSYAKCMTIQNGYYELTSHMKPMSKTDTLSKTQKCHFKKLDNDTLFSNMFHLTYIFKEKVISEILYDGTDLVTTFNEDSSGDICSKTLWADEIKSVRNNYRLHKPLTNVENSSLPNDSDLVNPNYSLRYVNEELINGRLCYHIDLIEEPENDSLDEIQTYKVEYHYWVNKHDSVPIQNSTTYYMVMQKDSMIQYDLNTLNEYELNNLEDENIFKMSSLPDYLKIKDFVPYESPELLPKDTMAPYWELSTPKDEKINLNDLKGQLVLIDFFYKSCYYCMLALPSLEELHNKYKDKGFRLIGIDPFDKKESDIASILEKRGVTYTVLLSEKDTPKEYNVSGYPTLYLIDKTGKIIFSQMGFTEELHKKLEQVIKDNL